MGEHVSILTELANRYFGHLALALLAALHIQPDNPELPIPQHVVMGFVLLVLVTLLCLILKPRLSVEKPGAMQQVAELLLTNPKRFGIRDILDEAVRHGGRSYIYIVGAIGLFVLLANLMSLFPLFTAPTGHVSVPLACASISFIYFNYQGIKHQGLWGYLKHFAGPLWWIAWLIFPVEIISTTARLLSLTVRLFANIFSSDLIYALFLSLLTQAFVWGWEKHPAIGIGLGIFPALIPLLFIALHLLVATVQAFIFTILPAVYLGMATTAEEH
jgi:F-type H+-transporting ATPase subunit a